MQYDNQDETQNHSPAPKSAKPSQKTVNPATDPTQQPAWTQAMRDQPPPGLQAKLTVNQPGDIYEQEADHVADQVMRMPTSATSTVQENTSLMRKPSGAGAQATQDAPPIVNQALSSGGQSLDANTRATMEPRFGQDFSQVKVHTDEQAAESAQAVSARAYTVGRDVVFGAGQYAPGTSEGQRLLAHELTHVVQQKNETAPLVQRFKVAKVADVPSAIEEDFSGVRVPGKWGQLSKKLQQRDKLVADRLLLVKAGSPEEATLIQLQGRWTALRALVSSSSFNPSSDPLPSSITGDRTDELSDMGALTGKANKFVSAAIQEFVNALNAYLRDRGTLDDEKTEYHRFDNLFTDPDVTTLLKAIPQATFTSADVKALVDQETGDLTNTEVVGISAKKSGIKTSRVNRGGHVGFGQHTASARDEAIVWAVKQRVVIPTPPDPRGVPAASVKLTAAFLGRVMDLLLVGLPATRPTGDELKKLVFAAYNGGHVGVIKAAKGFTKGKPVVYTWGDIMNQPGVTAQMRNYVSGIVGRLS